MVAAGEDTEFGRIAGGKRDPQRILARRNEPPIPILGPRYFAVQFHPMLFRGMG